MTLVAFTFTPATGWRCARSVTVPASLIGRRVSVSNGVMWLAVIGDGRPGRFCNPRKML